MKFFSVIFAGFFASSCYANSINIPNLLKRGVNFDPSAFSNSLSKECIEEQTNSEFNECLTTININNYKQICNNIKTEKCQKFLDNPLEFFPICKQSPEFAELFQPTLVKTLKTAFEVSCQTDENGDLCPLALMTIRQEAAPEALDDTCKSKVCTESAINSYKKIDIDQMASYENLSTTGGSYSYQELNSIKKILSKLESNECKAQYESNSSSITTSTKLGTSLLIAVLLLSFFY